MNEQTKSLIRHILTALGTILALIGLNNVIPIIDFLQSNLDGVWGAIEVLIGFIVALLGFFNDKGQRFKIRAEANGTK
jgi:phage-related protein